MPPRHVPERGHQPQPERSSHPTAASVIVLMPEAGDTTTPGCAIPDLGTGRLRRTEWTECEMRVTRRSTTQQDGSCKSCLVKRSVESGRLHSVVRQAPSQCSVLDDDNLSDGAMGQREACMVPFQNTLSCHVLPPGLSRHVGFGYVSCAEAGGQGSLAVWWSAAPILRFCRRRVGSLANQVVAQGRTAVST